MTLLLIQSPLFRVTKLLRLTDDRDERTLDATNVSFGVVCLLMVVVEGGL